MAKTKTYLFADDLIPTLKKRTRTKHEAEIREVLRKVADEVYENNLSPQYPTGEFRAFPNSRQRVIVNWEGFGSGQCNIQGAWSAGDQVKYSDLKTAKRIKDEYRQFVDKGFEKEIWGRESKVKKRVTTKTKLRKK